MPTNSSNTTSSRNEELLQQNLTKIERIRASGNKRLIAIITRMEQEVTRQRGEGGWLDYLASAPLETLMRKFSTSPVTSPNAKPIKDGMVPLSSGGHKKGDYDYVYSTETERQLLNEKHSATHERRREIDDELGAIHASRMQYLSNDVPFDESKAEEALRRHRERRARRNPQARATTTSQAEVPSSPQAGLSSGTAHGANGGGRPSPGQSNGSSATSGTESRYGAGASGGDTGTTSHADASSPANQGIDSVSHGDIGHGAVDSTGAVSHGGAGMPSGNAEPVSHGDTGLPPRSTGTATSGGFATYGTPGSGDIDHSDDFNPNSMRRNNGSTQPSTTPPKESDDDIIPVLAMPDPGDPSAPSSTPPSPNNDGDGIVTSGKPTSSADAPPLNTPSTDFGGNEESNRGVLVDGDEEGGNGRGSLDAGNNLGNDEAAKEAEEAKKKKEREHTKKLLRILLPLIMKLLPILVILLAVLMLAQCINDLNPFDNDNGSTTEAASTTGGGTTESANGTKTRRNSSTSMPQVQLSSGLSEMFGTSDEEEAEDEEDGEQDDGELTDAQRRVIEACKTTPSPGAGWCAAWVGDVFERANVGVTFRGDARDWWHAFCNPSEAPASCEAGTVKTDPSRTKLKPAMIIAVASSSSGSSAGATYGHIGIYIGDNLVMHNIGDIATCSVDEWINTYGQYADVGWGWADGIKLGGSGKGSVAIGEALDLHISSQKEIKQWAKKIDKYLSGHGAVQMGFKGEYFAEAAAQYGIDPRLSAAQSCIEQARGDVINPNDPYNLWGWGVYAGSNGLIHTSNAKDACFKHAKGLASIYGSSFGPAQVEMYCPGNSEYWPLLKQEAETISNL